MKKLINLFEENVTVGSLNLSNVSIDSNSSTDLISSALLKDINTAASNAGIKVEIGTAVSGHIEKTTSGNVSRHVGGYAVDIPITKQSGDALVAELVKLGYKSVKSETPAVPKSILWQVEGHTTHVHVSNTTGSSSGDGTSTTSGSDIDSYARETARNFLGNLIGKALGENEIKRERILKDIQKIKKLL